MGTVTVAVLDSGEETVKVTQAGPVTMTPPGKPVNRGPHTGSRTALRDVASMARPEPVPDIMPIRAPSRTQAGRWRGG